VVVRLRRWYVGRVEWVNTVGKVKCARRIVRSTRGRLEVQNETSAKICTQYNTHTRAHTHPCTLPFFADSLQHNAETYFLIGEFCPRITLWSSR